jgi:hypothetical protein
MDLGQNTQINQMESAEFDISKEFGRTQKIG